jgi:uncharacterized repeat protein (TIGR04138 family)
MDDAPVVDHDMPCVACGYNLRGLAVDRECAECGQPILRTLTWLLSSANVEVTPWVREAVAYVSRASFRPIAAAAGVSEDAVMFVRGALDWAEASGSPIGTAAEFCEAVRAHAVQYFGDAAEARDLLAAWGIGRSEDVGRIVYAMIDAKWLAPSRGDRPSDFDGLFTLEAWNFDGLR